VLVLSRSDGNHLLFAFPYARSLDSVREQLKNAPLSGYLRQLADKTGAAMTDLVPPPGTPGFTDDLAPVEELTRRMLME